jgi:cell division septation protein DedD
VEEVNRRLNGTQPRVLYKVQVGAYAAKDNALRMQKQLKEKGFDGFIVEVVQ